MDLKRIGMFCRLCSLQFIVESTFEKHLAIVHSHNNEIQIGKKLLTVSLVSKEKFKCSQCQSNFALSMQLKNTSV